MNFIWKKSFETRAAALASVTSVSRLQEAVAECKTTKTRAASPWLKWSLGYYKGTMGKG